MSDIRIDAISDGEFYLDGGAMFGVVPRVLWEKSNPPDERNRILLGMNCLLVEGPDYLALIDTGVGNKEDARFHDMFGLARRSDLFDALTVLGKTPEQITHVINTHLHFDHCGANTRLTDRDEVVPSFPGARYIVQKGEWLTATTPNEVNRASYLQRNFLPIADAGLLDLVEGELEILPGLTLIPTPGHTAHHQSILIDTGREKILYAGDLIPTSSHLPLPWIMAYDLYPLDTLETKRKIMQRQRDEGWLIFLEHEAGPALGQVEWVAGKKRERPQFRPLPDQ